MSDSEVEKMREHVRQKLEEFRTKVNLLAKEATEQSPIKEQRICNDKRRTLYCEMELLRLDYIELLPEDVRTSLKELEKDEVNGLIKAEQGKLQLLAQRRNFVLHRILHSLNFLLIAMVFMPFMMITSPTRYLRRRWCSLTGFTRSLTSYIEIIIARMYLFAAGVELDVEGEVKERSMLMFSHASNIDPFAMTAGSRGPGSEGIFLGKKDLLFVPMVGIAMYIAGHVFIDRGNLEKAKKSLDKARNYCEKHGLSLGISPEGTRSKTGQMLEFKKGPFHTQRAMQLSITPVAILGAFELCPPKTAGSRPGVVTVRYLDPIAYSEKDSVFDVQVKVKRALLKSMMVPPKRNEMSPITTLRRQRQPYLVFAACLVVILLYHEYFGILTPMIWFYQTLLELIGF
eukprot:Clim_evm7s165 gene=Clim_evmTU7s165